MSPNPLFMVLAMALKGPKTEKTGAAFAVQERYVNAASFRSILFGPDSQNQQCKQSANNWALKPFLSSANSNCSLCKR